MNAAPSTVTQLAWDKIWRHLRGWPLVVIGAVILLVGLWMGGVFRRKPTRLLTTPMAALEGWQAKSLYYNATAWGWLCELRPDLLRDEDRPATQSERVQTYAQAVQNWKLFRQLDRQERFDTLLFIGAPSQYRLLLDHLLETRDWSVAYVDHLTVIFHRGAGDWSVAKLAPLRERFAKGPMREQAIFLAQTAAKLIAVHQPAAARELLDAADKLGVKVAELPSVRAQYHLSRGEWLEALAAADRALAIDKSDLTTLGTKAQALYSIKRFGEAYAISKHLIAQMPDDPPVLFYHARLAHEAHDYTEEARALRRLIALAQANERPIAGYRVYLGQALASSGDASAALLEFALAIADPELPQDQRDFANDCVALLRTSGK